MKLCVFGLSLSSSWGNGHATTYRALLRAFAARGHSVTFFEWDAPWYRGSHRDLPEPDFLDLRLYDDWSKVRLEALSEIADADATIIGSYVHEGARIIDDLAESAVPLLFYDIDTPVTIAGLRQHGSVDYLRARQIPRFDAYLSFTGGPFLEEVIEGEFGARRAAPLFCSVDVDNYRPAAVSPEFAVDLAYMGTYAADRQPVVDRLLLEVARRRPRRSFIIAGPQYPSTAEWPANVTWIQHLEPSRHASFYSSAKWQLNATRAEMAAAGWSPSVRLFEAGAVGAAVLSDSWPGLEQLFTPGVEIQLPAGADEVVEIIEQTSEFDRRALGHNLRERVRAEHSSTRRAAELEAYLASLSEARSSGARSGGRDAEVTSTPG